MVIPAAPPSGPAPELYFLHKPSLRFSLDAADDPFWSVLQAHLEASSILEVGHSQSLGLWAFPVANASLDVFLPIYGEHLYVGVFGSGTAVFPSLTAATSYPAGAYTGYASAIGATASMERRSRSPEFELLFPISLDLVLFGSADVTSPVLDFAACTNPSYRVGA
jgi:hypothetical protein